MKTIILATITLACATASAALFDTVEQVEMRYGKPSSGNDGKFTYNKDGMQITVGFIAGRVHFLEYKRGKAGLSTDEAAALLEANKIGPNDWKPKAGRWIADGGAVEAVHNKRAGELSIFTKEWKTTARVERMNQLPPAVAASKTAVDPKSKSSAGKVKIGNRVLDRAAAGLEPIRGMAEKREEGRKWPFFVNRYPGVWVRTDAGERVLIFGSPATAGSRVDIEAADLHKKFEVRVLQQAEPVKD